MSDKKFYDALNSGAISTLGCEGMYTISAKEAERITVRRTSEDPKGYQRKLRQSSVDDIAESVKRGHEFAPCHIGLIDGQYECIDGQHRLLGHIQAGRPVKVWVQKLTAIDAANYFCRDNVYAKRLVRYEVVRASQNSWSHCARELAAKYHCSEKQAIAILDGLTGVTRSSAIVNASISDREVQAATMVAETWTESRLFTAKPNYYGDNVDTAAKAAYSSCSTMYCLGRIAKERLNAFAKLKKDLITLRGADWRAGRAGSSLRGLSGSGTKFRLRLLERMKATCHEAT